MEKEIQKEIDECSNADEVISILTKYKSIDIKGATLGKAFEKIFHKNDGFSDDIKMDDLIKLHKSFLTTNGSTWCRSNSSYLGKKYMIKRSLSGGRISSVRLDGYNKSHTISNSIRKDIADNIKNKRCVILDISTNIECDHKEGMKDDWRLNDRSQQTIEDFQPLCKTANDAKRQHCKKCKECGIRYDARKLGYKYAFILGDENTKVCTGCYWYDPVKFNKTMTKDFEK